MRKKNLRSSKTTLGGITKPIPKKKSSAFSHLSTDLLNTLDNLVIPTAAPNKRPEHPIFDKKVTTHSQRHREL